MNFLFLTDEYYPNFGANSLVVRRVCRELVSRGHQVYVMPAGYDKTLPSEEAFEGACVVRGLPADSKENMLTAAREGRFLKASKVLAMMLGGRFGSVHKLWHKKKICAREYLARFIKEKDISVAVSINCSVELSFPLLSLREKGKLPCKWYFYMLDPFADHEYYQTHYSKGYLRQLQHRIMKNCDRVLATQLIYDGIAQWECPCILEKITKTEFPKIEKPEYILCTDEITLDPGFTHVVCTGSKNEQVRSSDFALALCRRVEDLPVKFHFVGYGWTEEGEAKQEKNCIFYPPHSPQSAKNLQLKADFLLNIGNSVVNQLPSKVLEYISTGKPVINTYKKDTCPAKALLEDTGNLNLWEGGPLDEAEEKLRTFLENPRESQDFAAIEKQFARYTPAYVTDQFLTQ